MQLSRIGWSVVGHGLRVQNGTDNANTAHVDDEVR